MAKAITVIPATKDKFTELPTASIKKRKVAAYARVSTDSDEQFTSYEAQIDYYTQYIKKRDDWEFVKVYTDEGISGTNTKRREGFNEMVADALAGKIDLIFTTFVPNIRIDILPQKSYFPETPAEQILCLIDYRLWVSASFASASVWHNTVRTKILTASHY